MIYPYLYLKDTSIKKIKKQSKLNPRKIGGVLLIFVGLTFFLSFLVVPLSKAYFGQTAKATIVKAVNSDFLNEPGNLTALDLTLEIARSRRILGDATQSISYTGPEFFYISIPKLKIKNATIKANSLNPDPDEELIHIAGTSAPGETGNVFITGHSNFKYLFNPKDYKSIFAKLDELVVGDLIEINYGNEIFKYLVSQREILKPEDVLMYKENYPNFLNKQTATLMTCFPPGTLDYRLLVTAELAN